MENATNHTRNHIGLIVALVASISVVTLMLSPGRHASAQAVAPSWSYTGNLNEARAVHTATLLHNGKVLVVAGRNFNAGGGIVNSAELYDSSTGTWSSTGNLNTSRFAHTATLLVNGKVLVVGGYGDSQPLNPLNSAELYDPATGTWSSTGNLNTPRAGWHTATLLPNGKVVVVGGIVDGDGHPTNSAELYDPASGTWTSTGNLNSLLSSTAMLLPNGKVLVFDQDDNAELYDSATGAWSITVNPAPFRYSYSTTLLQNGKVLLAGGFEYDCFGVCPSNSAELYDPATGTWSSTGNLNTGGYVSTATLLLSGKVLVVGGNSAELYDLATGTWSITASLNTSRVAPTATLLSNGKVLVAGGNVSGGPGTLNTTELYDSGTTSNPIDDVEFFVTQHYRDFLNREPDADGLGFWTHEISLCGADQQCIEAKRTDVSASFFLSIEFQNTGYLVERFYKAAYGDATGNSTFGGAHQLPVPIVRLNEFLPDTRQIGQGVIVGKPGWEQQLENNKQAFVADFVQRSRFTSALPTSMTAAQFVDTLNANAGGALSTSERNQLVNDLTSGAKTRAQVLRAVAEDQDLYNAEFNRAFVLMQYFGYMHRNPNDPQDTDYTGYDFWLTKLNQFNGNFINAEMVKAFISSIEYRQRFGP